MKLLYKNTYLVAFTFGLCLFTTSINAHDIASPLDINLIENQVYNSRNFLESREDGFLIDTSIAYIPAIDDQAYPSIAFDGTNYLVVWQDNRSGPYDIYGARVDQTGNVLDPAGIAISTFPCFKSDPSIAFDGTNYLVVWLDRRSGSWSDIYGARVAQSGTVLDTAGIAISTAVNGQSYPCVAFDGTNYLVVWQDNRSGIMQRDVYGARVDQSGNVLDSTGIAISTAPNNQWYPSVIYDGTNFLVVWGHQHGNWPWFQDIYGARVDQAGNVLDPNGIIISMVSNCQKQPSVASDGTNYLVVWMDQRGGSYDIYGARVDQSGVVLDPVGIAISTAVNNQASPDVAFDGTNYLVVWEEEGGYDIYCARLTTAGVVLDPAGIAISTAPDEQEHPAVAFDGTNYLIAWKDGRNGGYYQEDIYASKLDQTGNVLDPDGILISTAANQQQNPSVAFNNANYLVVWEDGRNGFYWDIYGARVDQNGNVVDPTAIAISTATDYQHYPAVACDGTNYLVVWEDHRNGAYESDIYGARVDQNGTVLDSMGIEVTISTYGRFPSVTFDGSNYFVVWDTGEGCNAPIFGARIDQLGVVLDPSGIAISHGTYHFHYEDPVVAFDGTNYLVVWQAWAEGWGVGLGGVRVDTSGNVLDPVDIHIAQGDCFWPAIAFDGVNFFVVWEESGDIYGTRVDQSGNVLDTAGIPISTAPYAQEQPSISFDGTHYVVVWRDSRNDSVHYDIHGARISPSGIITESFAVSTQSGRQFAPAIAHGAEDQLLITYTGWTGSNNDNPINTMRIWGEFYPFVGIAEDGRFMVKNSQYNLHVYPNPFTHNIKISFSVGHNAKGIEQRVEGTELKIYDATGRLIKSFNHVTNQIFDQVVWDGRDDAGKKLPSGVYFLKFETGDYSATEKLLMIR